MSEQQELVELTPSQKKELIDMLKQKHQELTEKLQKRREKTEIPEAAGAGDEADQAVEGAGISLEARLLDRDAKLLREVERALDKVKDDTYGLCEGTDEPIGYARLKLRPWTRYSVQYKEELERESKRTIETSR